jgi:hypothetical protein
MSNLYADLMAGLDRAAEPVSDVSGIDAFLSPSGPVKVASISDLASFFRVSEDTLIHKAQKDLWRIAENPQGDVVIERLFDPTTNSALKV